MSDDETDGEGGRGRDHVRGREGEAADEGTRRGGTEDGTRQDRRSEATHRASRDYALPDDPQHDTPPWHRTPHRADALLLARVSEAAGRARLGRRCATYRPPVTEPARRQAVLAAARRLLPGAERGGSGSGPAPRLDLYEHGLTVAVDGRIHVVRYDGTVVRRRRALSPQGLVRAHVLVDVGGERIALRCGDFGEPEVWGPEIHRSVADAQVPRALAALARGERLDFGPVWITRAELGSRGTTLRWAQVQRIEILRGSVAVRTAGRWQVWGSVRSGIPNLCVLHALTEYLTAAERDDG
ncbi:DUF6585 family protein [Streptomyces sp. Y7]|uniref:DUF6585 family protein n=1 Tax=Streptomyces sp. Y7 TaxID=3342392 RepID=UPI0037179343